MKNQNETMQVRLIKTLSLLPLLAIVGCSFDDSDSQIEDSTVRARSALTSASKDDHSPEVVASARTCPSDLPAVLDVPADATLAAMLPARGVQIYTCTAAVPGTPPVWTLKAPHAVLGKPGDLEAIHFAGPSWQATDGSLVVGSKVAAAALTSPPFHGCSSRRPPTPGPGSLPTSHTSSVSIPRAASRPRRAATMRIRMRRCWCPTARTISSITRLYRARAFGSVYRADLNQLAAAANRSV